VETLCWQRLMHRAGCSASWPDGPKMHRRDSATNHSRSSWPQRKRSNCACHGLANESSKCRCWLALHTVTSSASLRCVERGVQRTHLCRHAEYRGSSRWTNHERSPWRQRDGISRTLTLAPPGQTRFNRLRIHMFDLEDRPMQEAQPVRTAVPVGFE